MNRFILAEKQKELLYKVIVILGFLLVIFLSFYKLDAGSIRDWDEARHGVNAYEMLKNNEWLVTTYGYEKDYWNLKPPLSDWLIILGYKIFGFNTWGLRLYSALSHLVTVILCFLFAKKYFGRLAAIFTLYSFAAWKIYYIAHYVRHGDADSFYIMLFVIMTLSLCKMYENKRYLYLACICCALSFLAKATHAGIFAVCIFICVFGSGFIKKLTAKEIVKCVLLAAGPMFLWALARYIADGPKFLEQMIFYDVVARSTKTIEGHIGGPTFYIREYLRVKFAWIIAFLVICFAVLQKKCCNAKVNLKPIFVAIAVPFILFSIVKSKFPWYVWGAYPLLCILAGYGLKLLYERIPREWTKLILMIGIVSVLAIPISYNVKWTLRMPKDNIAADHVPQLVQRSTALSMQKIYFVGQDGKDKWQQSSFLAMELYGDMTPKMGGLPKFEEDKNSYLMIEKSQLHKVKVKYKICSNSKSYVLLRHIP